MPEYTDLTASAAIGQRLYHKIQAAQINLSRSGD